MCSKNFFFNFFATSDNKTDQSVVYMIETGTKAHEALNPATKNFKRREEVMKKLTVGLLGMAAMLVVVPETMAAPHGGRHGRGNEGLRLAAGIVHLVKDVIAPRPAVIVPHRPAVIVPPRHAVKYHKPKPHTPPRKHKPAPPRPAKKGHRR